MTQSSTGGVEMLRNLATALRQQPKPSDAPALPTATDQDILRAMLGKPMTSRTVQAKQTPKTN